MCARARAVLPDTLKQNRWNKNIYSYHQGCSKINAADTGNERIVNFASVARADLSSPRSGRDTRPCAS